MVLPGLSAAPLLMGGKSKSPTTWNPFDKSTHVALSNGNLTATKSGAVDGGYHSVRGTTAKSSGKFYFEVRSGVPLLVGVATSAQGLDIILGSAMGGASYLSASGAVRVDGSVVATYSTYTTNTLIGVALDLDNMRLYFARGGSWQGGSNPDIGTGGLSISAGEWFPAVGVYDADSSALANFGASPFTHSPPSGFSAWDMS